MPEVNPNQSLPENGLYARQKERIDRIMAKFPNRRSGLIPLLWVIQEEDGWISPEAMREAAALCGCTPAEALEVASFYQMFHRQPVGRYVLGICGTLPCALSGADGLYGYLKERLGIGWGETTPDGLFTIERRECLGACSEAPLMLVNQELETKLTREKVDAILEECRNGTRRPYATGRNEMPAD